MDGFRIATELKHLGYISHVNINLVCSLQQAIFITSISPYRDTFSNADNLSEM